MINGVVLLERFWNLCKKKKKKGKGREKIREKFTEQR